MTTAASEITRNVWMHAHGGTALIEEIEERGRLGLRVEFRDQGPGIPDIPRVLAGGYSTARSLGLGPVGEPAPRRRAGDRERARPGDDRAHGEVDTLLMASWMAGADALPTIDEASVSAAREAVRSAGAALGLHRDLVESVAVAASELVHNQLRHARRGRFAVRPITRGGVPGLEILAADLGPGIAAPGAALAGVGPSPASLGEGLAGARRMTDELDVDVRWGEGTCLRARAFAAPVPRRREVGVLGRRLRGEPVSGDHAVFVREGEGALLLAVIDGLGHGPLAQVASAEAAAAVLANRGVSPLLVLDACDAALQGTRGAVMAVAYLDEDRATVEHAAAGNVTSRIVGPGRTYTLATSATTLGMRGRRRKPAVETVPLAAGGALILFTDGLSSRAGVVDDADFLRAHPVVIAERLMAEYARDNDDALVLVAR